MGLLFCSRCHSRLHMHALVCPRCLAALGFVPGPACTMAFGPAPDGDGPWQGLVPPSQAAQPGLALRPCLNRWPHGVCNGMLDPGDGHALCRSCRLTVLIPDLSRPIYLLAPKAQAVTSPMVTAGSWRQAGLTQDLPQRARNAEARTGRAS